MPIYDYLCSNCRHLTEVIHGINDAGPRFCPSCGKEGTMKKMLSTPTVHFKGSGWAKKDRSSTSANRTKASAASSTEGGSGDTSSSGDSSSSGSGSSSSTSEGSGSSSGAGGSGESGKASESTKKPAAAAGGDD